MYKQLTVAIMVAVMLVSGCVLLASDDSEALDVGGSTGITLTQAINAVSGDNQVAIVLTSDINEDITIPSGKNISLDLNGYTLQSPEGSTSNTIMVQSGAELTIIDSVGGGTVDCTVNGKSALYNYGTISIDGGDFIRSAQVPFTTNGPTPHTYYLVENEGTMTINGGTFIGGYIEDGAYVLGNVSSLIRNTSGTLTITDGTFRNGANVVKTETNGTTSISGGEYIMDNETIAWYGGNHLVQNYGSTTITGGDFQALGDGVSEDKDYSYYRYGVWNAGSFCAVSNITLTMEGNQNVVFCQFPGNDKISPPTGEMILTNCVANVGSDNSNSMFQSGGTHALVVNSGTYAGTVRNGTTNLQIKAGTFTGDYSDISEYVAEGSQMVGNIVGPKSDTEISSGSSNVTVDTDDDIVVIPVQDGGVSNATVSATINASGDVPAGEGADSNVSMVFQGSIDGNGLAMSAKQVASSALPDTVIKSNLLATFDLSVQGATAGNFNLTVTVSIPTPVGMVLSNVWVIYYDDSGVEQDRFDATVNGSEITFSTTHTSAYSVYGEYEEEGSGSGTGTWDDDEDLPPFIPTQPAKDDNTVTIVACAAAAAVAAIMAVFLIIDRKG